MKNGIRYTLSFLTGFLIAFFLIYSDYRSQSRDYVFKYRDYQLQLESSSYDSMITAIQKEKLVALSSDFVVDAAHERRDFITKQVIMVNRKVLLLSLIDYFRFRFYLGDLVSKLPEDK